MSIYNLQMKKGSETLSNLSKDAQPSLRAQSLERVGDRTGKEQKEVSGALRVFQP